MFIVNCKRKVEIPFYVYPIPLKISSYMHKLTPDTHISNSE